MNGYWETLRWFFASLDMSTGPDKCWVWDGARFESGYGQLTIGRKHYRAHRWLVCFILGEELERDLLVLHRCHNPPCCNPRHLYVGDQKDNMRDMHEAGRQGRYWSRRTHCAQGHEYTPENTRIYRGYRRCRKCDRRRRTTPTEALAA
jgi:hypothetical protein